MKNSLFFVFALSIFSFAACDKDDVVDGVEFQNHDASTMMSLMHDMMEEMEGMQPTNDPDEDFAMMMHHHHEGAIAMGEELLQSGNDATLKQLATEMIAKQRAEQAELMQFMESHAANLNKPEYTAEIMEIMEHLSGDKDIQPLTGDADHDFAVLTIPHHESAIEMAEALLQHGEETMTRQMAQEMIEDQKMEIRELQDWLKANKPY